MIVGGMEATIRVTESSNPVFSGKSNDGHQKCQGKHSLSVFEPEYKSDASLRN
jgi:hypothetical protein